MKREAIENRHSDRLTNPLASGLLHRLCKHADVKDRLHLAENKQTPVELLVALSCDSNPQVRLAVAENASAQHYLVETAVDDVSVDVRYGLAENPHLPAHLLKKLACDQNPYVADRAEQTLARVVKECIQLHCFRKQN